MNLFVRVLNVLLAVAIAVLACYVIVWVLGLIGFVIPAKIQQLIFVIIGLIALIGALTGRIDPWSWFSKSG